MTCTEHESDIEPPFIYNRVCHIELDLEDSFGTALNNYFADRNVKSYCEVCGKETTHELDDRKMVVMSNILSFSVPRFDVIDRYTDKFNYPRRIEHMNQYSSEFVPNYELFAVIANRGQTLQHRRYPFNKDKNHYVTIVKRENGDVIEFDPLADAPVKLSDPMQILKEEETVEILFYKESSYVKDEKHL